MAAEIILSILKPFAHVALIKRVFSPKKLPSIPQLLQNGQLVDASKASERVGKGQLAYCEDVRLWDSTRLAICALDPSRPIYNPFTGEGAGATAPSGKLGFYQLDTQQITLIEVLDIVGWPVQRPFHPLGMDLLEVAPAQEAILAVVSYAQKSPSIEMLRIVATDSKITVHHERTIEHPEITSPNAVVALSPTNILFTESFACSPRTKPFLHKLEQSLALPGGSVKALSIDPSGNVSCKTLASSISLANGLALNEDMTVLAAAGCLSLNVHLYDVTGAKEGGITHPDQLTYRTTIAAGFLTDNMAFAPRTSADHDTLIVAGHPGALAYVKTTKTKGKSMSGSKVVQIQVDRNELAQQKKSLAHRASTMFDDVDKCVSTLFESQGDFYGTSTTANIYVDKDGKRYMLVNGLWEDSLLKLAL